MSPPTVPTTWATPGRATVAAVAAAVRELQGANRLRTVLVVTPPGATATTLRRLLPSVDGRGIAGIRFTTLPDLALDLAPAEIRRRRPITPLLLTAAVHDELANRCPKVLAAVRDHPATVDALVQAADRLGSLALADDLDEVSNGLAQGSTVRRALVAVALAARRAVTDKGFRDEASVFAATHDALASGATTVTAPVVAVVTDTFHPAQVGFLQSILRAAPGAAVIASRAADGDPDLIAQLERITGHAERLPGAAPDRIVSCPDHDEEVRWAARTVVQRVTGPDAIDPEQIVVLHPPGGAHARAVRDEFERAGLATSGPAIETLAAATAGQVLRLLLDAFDDGCDREHVLHIVAVAPQWPFGDGPRRNAARWRRLCRDAGVVTAADWASAEQRLADAQRARRERSAAFDDDIDPEMPSERDTWDLDAMRTLVGLAQRMTGHAIAYRRATSWVEAADALATALADHIGTDEWRERQWATAPVWQRRAAEQVGTLLGALAQFDHDDTSMPFTPNAMRRVLTTELDRRVRRAGDTTQGVRVLPMHHGVCLDAQLVVVVGANDGLLPPGRTDDLIVPRDLPEACAAVVEHTEWHRHRLHRAWRAVLASSAETIVTWARTDLRRGGDIYPSTWIAGLDTEHHASHAAGARDLPALTAADAIARRGTAGVAADANLRRRSIALTSRTLADASAFDGWVGPHPEHDPTATVQAITRFESHARCGLSYFVEKVLGVDTGTDPSEITEIEPMTKGNLAHRVLERLANEWLAIPIGDRPPWLQGAHLTASLQRVEELLDDEAVTLAEGNLLGHPHAWAIERDLLLAAIRSELRTESDARISPLAVELAFGFTDSATAPFAVDVDDLGTVEFRGRVDRIDRSTHGLLVTDFKTSRAAQTPRVSTADVRDGVRLQLPLYARVAAAAARALGLDSPDGAPLDAESRYVYLRRDTSDVVPFKPEHDAAFDVVVPHTARRIAHGDFRPAVPDEQWGAPVIAPDGLGLGDIAARASGWRCAPEFPDNLTPTPVEHDA